jgi:hypothetical protein
MIEDLSRRLKAGERWSIESSNATVKFSTNFSASKPRGMSFEISAHSGIDIAEIVQRELARMHEYWKGELNR